MPGRTYRGGEGNAPDPLVQFERAPGSKARPVDTQGQRRRNLKTFRKRRRCWAARLRPLVRARRFIRAGASGIVGATPWQAQSSNCRPARTCGNTCAERGGVETRNSEGEECVGTTLPKCSTSGNNSGNDGGEEGEGAWSIDTDGDGENGHGSQ